MKNVIKRILIAALLVNSLGISGIMVSASESNSSNASNGSNTSKTTTVVTETELFEKVLGFNSGEKNEDGGVEEIVDYNKDNKNLYSVNGKKGVIDVISTSDLSNKEGKLEKEINIKEALPKAIEGSSFKDFKYGDMTSLSVSEKNKLIAVALQDEDYSKNGLVVFIDYEGNIKKISDAGVQPDMVVFSPDEKYVLTANEGEPRKGYEGAVDPMGSVSIIEVTENGDFTSTVVDFKDFDSKVEDLAKSGVVLKKDSKPSLDLEPEFITVDEKGQFAYVTLQENNAIAKINIETKKAETVFGLGFKNFNEKDNELDLKKDKKIEIKNENVFGIYMPDAVASYEVSGVTYLLTANEGDSREWEKYLNEVEKDDIVYFMKDDYLGLDAKNDYIFGGRSFSIFKVNEDKLELVYDSGSTMEKVTSEKFPEFFNASNDKIKLDNRSGKKGPEPEGIAIGKVGEKVYAFVALERIGGIMAFDITDPAKVDFVDYINTRDFSEDIAGDVAPEGLVFIDGETPMLAVAYEVSGTVALFKIKNLK